MTSFRQFAENVALGNTPLPGPCHSAKMRYTSFVAEPCSNASVAYIHDEQPFRLFLNHYNRPNTAFVVRQFMIFIIILALLLPMLNGVLG